MEELSDYSFTIEHSPGTKMFSNYLSRFSNDNIETDSISFLTSRKDLTGNLYINNDISGACNNIAGQPVSREDHSFPLTCSQTRAQNISLPGLFSAGEDAAKTRVRQQDLLHTRCLPICHLLYQPINYPVQAFHQSFSELLENEVDNVKLIHRVL